MENEPVVNEVILLFDESEYAEAKVFLSSVLGERSFETGPVQTLKDWSGTATVALDLAHVAVPVLGGALAIWLGKGKRVIVKRGEQLLDLRNVREEQAKNIVVEFLEHTDDD